MPGEALLIGIATVAVVVAGFAAIAPGIAPDAATWTTGHRIRLRAIVSTSFNVSFESLLPAVLFPALSDERSTLVVASALVFAYLLVVIGVRFVQLWRAGALRSRPARFTVAAGVVATALFGLNALVFVSLTAYGLALLIQLTVAAISFYSLLAGSS
jgi:Na+/H+-dicarboxylate symporter